MGRDEDLADAYRTLESGEPNRVILFAQLPCELQIGPEWLDVPADLGQPQLRCRRVGTSRNRIEPGAPFSIVPRHRLGDAESFTNGALPQDPYGLMIRTQILVSFQLWEQRRRYYRRYLDAATHESTLRAVLVEPRHSWLKSRRAISADAYEDDLVNRLHREAERLLPAFVEAYAVVCMDAGAASAEHRIDCVFMMVAGGRIVVRGPGASALAGAVRPLREQPNAAANLHALRGFLRSRRPVSVYERYLLESARHIEMGAPNLAIVQGVMIVEWFVNEVIADRMLRPLAKTIADDAVSELVTARLADRGVRLHDKLRRYLPSLGLRLTAALQTDTIGDRTAQPDRSPAADRADRSRPGRPCGADADGGRAHVHGPALLTDVTGVPPLRHGPPRGRSAQPEKEKAAECASAAFSLRGPT